MKTILELITLSEKYLQGRAISRPRREAEDLLAHVLGVGRLDLYLRFEAPLEEEELAQYRLHIKRRGEGEPFAQIVERVPFLDVTLHITRDVLTPRPETELLAAQICEQLEKENREEKILWDVCSGSGCLGIALKKRFPELTVILSDLSPKACSLAQENALSNGVEVEVREGDLFAPFQGEQVDYFVCNPPYVAEEEYAHLSKEVLSYEPKEALVAGERGLAFYRRIAQELPLKKGGRAWLEVGHRQGEAILSLFQEAGWRRCHISKDWAAHDRFFFLENEP